MLRTGFAALLLFAAVVVASVVASSSSSSSSSSSLSLSSGVKGASHQQGGLSTCFMALPATSFRNAVAPPQQQQVGTLGRFDRTEITTKTTTTKTTTKTATRSRRGYGREWRRRPIAQQDETWTRLYLFFHNREDSTRHDHSTHSSSPSSGGWHISNDVLDELSRRSMTLPYECSMGYYDGKGDRWNRREDHGASPLWPTKPRHLATSAAPSDTCRLVVRKLTTKDLDQVIPMVVKEFGDDEDDDSDDDDDDDEIRGKRKPEIEKWIDDFENWIFSFPFATTVRMSFAMKIQRQKQGDNPALRKQPPDYNILCLEDVEQSKVVGIVELSRQPLKGDRNPPPVPIPNVIKHLYAKANGLPQINGWVTNLLIDEDYRGRGLSKVLMKATEGMAKQWGCTSISLHVAADIRAGRIPQSLYFGLGYEPVVDNQASQKYRWMGPQMIQKGLFMVEGVPLLFLRKELS